MRKKQFALITTETKTFTAKKLLQEAKNIGVQAYTLNPFKTSLAIKKNQLIITEKGKTIITPAAVYRKTITTPLAKTLEFFLWKMGAKVINPWDKLTPHTKGKFGIYQILAKNQIPVPKSFLLTKIDQKDLCLKFFNYQFPLIVKTNSGTHGIGVFLVESLNSFKSLVDYLLGNKNQQEIIIQEFIASSFGRDKRIVVLDGKILAAVERRNQKGDFRSNVFLGADVYPTKITPTEEKIVLKTMAVLGLNFGGLDMLFGKNSPVITEINAPCDYSFVEKVTNVPISREIIKFLLKV
jgi:RimK family alpha-L-glutamate ligase